VVDVPADLVGLFGPWRMSAFEAKILDQMKASEDARPCWQVTHRLTMRLEEVPDPLWSGETANRVVLTGTRGAVHEAETQAKALLEDSEGFALDLPVHICPENSGLTSALKELAQKYSVGIHIAAVVQDDMNEAWQHAFEVNVSTAVKVTLSGRAGPELNMAKTAAMALATAIARGISQGDARHAKHSRHRSRSRHGHARPRSRSRSNRRSRERRGHHSASDR